MFPNIPNNIELKTFTGNHARAIFNDLAWLRIQIFKSFPYLYLGELAYEEKYLERYFQSSSFFVAALYDKSQIIGATTAIGLTEESEEIKLPLIKSGFNPLECFYFGESLLLEPYRGLGLGHLFFNLREQQALLNPEIRTTLFCSVIRSTNHPSRPANYLSHDIFWKKRGYQPLNTFCEMSWKDLDQTEETIKSLQFWKKDWK